jgi:hypothetical protein
VAIRRAKLRALKTDAYALFDLYLDNANPLNWKRQSATMIGSAYNYFVKIRSPKGTKHPTTKSEKLAALEVTFEESHRIRRHTLKKAKKWVKYGSQRHHFLHTKLASLSFLI